MSEIAVVSARKSKLLNEARLGSKSAETALKLIDDPNKFLSIVQIGITLIGILTGIYSGAALADKFSIVLANIGFPSQYSHFVAQTSIVISVTYFTIVFGELVPKRIGMSLASTIAKHIAKPMSWLSIIASPFVWLLSKSTILVSNLLGLKHIDSKVTEDEIKSLIQEGTINGEVKEVEQSIMERVFNLGNRRIESLMTYRTEIVLLDVNLSKTEMFDTIRAGLHITYPVMDKTIDNLLGIVSLKDIFGNFADENFNLHEIIRPALFLHEGIGVYEALAEMKEKHSKCAIICDEYGSMQGIVTYKDVLESLLGELPDANDSPSILQRQDGGWLIDGQCEFYYFLEYFEIEHLYTDYKYNTLSGLLIEKLGRMPQTGDKLEWNQFVFEIVDIDGFRIDKLLVTKM